jgi:hypothetical protein
MTDRNIEVTFTRVHTWYITAPCGWFVELPGECHPDDVRTMAYGHKRRCCRTARLSVETATGYRESNTRKDRAA